LQEGRENPNIDAGLGFIWRISVEANWGMEMGDRAGLMIVRRGEGFLVN